MNGTRTDDSGTSKMGGSSVENADVVITMTNGPSFAPESIEIEVGEMVGWQNHSRQIHTVTATEDRIPDKADYFASGGFSREVLATIVYPFNGGIDPGEEFVHRFETQGEYEYYSIPSKHHSMVGEVVVQ